MHKRIAIVAACAAVGLALWAICTWQPAAPVQNAVVVTPQLTFKEAEPKSAVKEDLGIRELLPLLDVLAGDWMATGFLKAKLASNVELIGLPKSEPVTFDRYGIGRLTNTKIRFTGTEFAVAPAQWPAAAINPVTDWQLYGVTSMKVRYLGQNACTVIEFTTFQKGLANLIFKRPEGFSADVTLANRIENEHHGWWIVDGFFWDNPNQFDEPKKVEVHTTFRMRDDLYGWGRIKSVPFKFWDLDANVSGISLGWPDGYQTYEVLPMIEKEYSATGGLQSFKVNGFLKNGPAQLRFVRPIFQDSLDEYRFAS